MCVTSTAAAAPVRAAPATGPSGGVPGSPAWNLAGRGRRSAPSSSPRALRRLPDPAGAHPFFGDARGVLALGIGGGGDVVGALGVAEVARAAGLPARVGGGTGGRPP